jgi:hypothetical protein
VGENGFGYGWNLSSYLKARTGATAFVALTWGGIDSSKRDCLYALDNAGYVWILRYSGTSSINLGYIKTDLVSNYGLSFPQYDSLQYCSLVTGDNADTLYLSYFTGSTNQLYELDYSTSAKSYVSMLIGDVGEDVWPAALFMASSNSDDSDAADTAISSAVEASITEVATLEAEDLTAQLSDIVEEDTPLADGSLNSTADRGAEDEDGNEIKDGITVTVTAKDATGADVDSTNGVITVSYDADALTVQQVITTSAADLTSVNVEDGTITIGYVSLDGIAAGETVATVIFLPTDTYAAQTITVAQKEVGSEQSGYSEDLTIDARNLDNVTITKTIGHKTGNILYWDAVDNAKFYQVFRRTSGQPFEFVTNTTSLAYKDTTAEPGVTYIYAVKAANGSLRSETYSNQVSVVRALDTVVINTETSIAHKTGNIIRWDAVDGAQAYVVYRRTAGHTFEQIARTSSTAYKDTTAEAGVTYTYMVRAAVGYNLSPAYSNQVSLTRPQ